MMIEKSISEEEKKNKAAEISIKEGTGRSVMEGFGVRYITPYALSLGASNFAISLISSLPDFIGHLLQAPFINLTRKKSRKKIITTFVFIQALLWWPIVGVGFLYFANYIQAKTASYLLIIFYVFMTISGVVIAPLWNSWMNDIIERDSGSYFGKRNMVKNIVIIVSLIIAGIILHCFKKSIFMGFVIIFLIASLGRMFSAYLFTKKYEPKFSYEKGYHFSFVQFIKQMCFNNFGKFVIFVSLISFATAIASPFFAVYMLKDLKLSYLNYMLITLSSIIGTIVFVKFWGRFADKYGYVKILKINCMFIPLIPLLWIFSVILNDFNIIFLVSFLMLANFFSGCVWSGFNLASANFIYDAVTKQRLPICFAYFNIIDSFGTILGSMLGGIFLSYKGLIFNIKPILFIFMISVGLRIIFAIVFGSMINEVKDVESFSIKEEIKEIKDKLKRNKNRINWHR